MFDSTIQGPFGAVRKLDESHGEAPRAADWQALLHRALRLPSEQEGETAPGGEMPGNTDAEVVAPHPPEDGSPGAESLEEIDRPWSHRPGLENADLMPSGSSPGILVPQASADPKGVATGVTGEPLTAAQLPTEMNDIAGRVARSRRSNDRGRSAPQGPHDRNAPTEHTATRATAQAVAEGETHDRMDGLGARRRTVDEGTTAQRTPPVKPRRLIPERSDTPIASQNTRPRADNPTAQASRLATAATDELVPVGIQSRPLNAAPAAISKPTDPMPSPDPSSTMHEPRGRSRAEGKVFAATAPRESAGSPRRNAVAAGQLVGGRLGDLFALVAPGRAASASVHAVDAQAEPGGAGADAKSPVDGAAPGVADNATPTADLRQRDGTQLSRSVVRIAADTGSGDAPRGVSVQTDGSASSAEPQLPVEAARVRVANDAAPRTDLRSAVETIVSRARLVPANGRVELHFRLDPPELGEVSVRMHSQGDRLHVRIVVASAAAADALNQGLSRLTAQLQDSGISDAQVELEFRGDQGGTEPRQPPTGGERRSTPRRRAEPNGSTDLAPGQRDARPGNDGTRLDRIA